MLEKLMERNKKESDTMIIIDEAARKGQGKGNLSLQTVKMFHSIRKK